MPSLRMMAVAALIAVTPAAARAECLAVEFVYQHRDAVLALKDPVKKSDYIRKAVSSTWAATSDAASKTVMAYGMGEGLATAPSRALAERALSLSHGEMLKLAKGAPVDQQRIAKALSKIKEGAAITDDLNIWMDRLGIAVDAINLIDWTIEGMKTGDRYAKAKAAQSAMSIARTVTAKVAGGTMGAMMASVGFLDYAVTSFGDAAHAAYDARWYAAYKDYYDHYNGRDAAFWLNLREKGGDNAVEAELNAFWNDPWSWAEMQGLKTGSLPFAKDALAAATQKKAYAARYMAERIEPMVAAEAERRANEAWKQASKDYQRACYAAQAEAKTLQAVDAILAGLDDGNLEEKLREALRADDAAKVKTLLAQGADPFKPVEGAGAYDTALAVFMAGIVKPQVVEAFLEAGLTPDKAFKGRPQTVITAAVDKGSAEAVRFLAAKGFDVNQPRQDGRTPLMLAAAAGKVEAVAILLAAGAAVDAVDGQGIAALGYAANGSKATVVPLLLAAGAQPNRLYGNGLTPLAVAAARGDMATVKALVEGGANPAMKAKAGTPSHYAEQKGHTQVADYLKKLEKAAPALRIASVTSVQDTIALSKSAPIDLRIEGDFQGPLDWKLFIDDPSILGWRRRGTPENGAFPFEIVGKKEGAATVTVRATDAAGNRGEWSLTLTAQSSLGDPFTAPDVYAVAEMMRLPDGLLLPDPLTELSAVMKVPAKREGETAGRRVELAVYAPDGRRISSFDEEVEYIKSYGPEDHRRYRVTVELCQQEPSRGGSRCRDAGEYRIVGRHLSGAQVKETVTLFRLGDPYEREAENWGIGPAVAAGDLARLERVAATGKAKLFDTGFTELEAAARSDNPALVKAVIAFGVDPRISVAGHTPLLRAMMTDGYAPNAARALIAAGADINAAWPKTLLTPLHLAAMARDKDMVNFLLSRGARATKDDHGNTPGYYVYWLTKDADLAVAAGYREARDYEAKANDPGFDWAEFARRMQPALQQFGQQMSSIRQQHAARVDQINRNYDRSMAQAWQPTPPPYAPQPTPVPSPYQSAAPKAQNAAKPSGRTKWTGGPVCLVSIRLEGTDSRGEHVRESVTAFTAPGCRTESGSPAPNGPSFSACGRKYYMNGAWAESRRDKFVQAAASLRGRGAKIEIIPQGSVDQNYGYTYLDRCAP